MEKLSKDQVVELRIEDMSTEGQGVGRLVNVSDEEGRLVVFVADTVPGDLVKAQLTKVKKNYAFAKLIEIIEPSKDRCAEKFCELDSCGGCQLREIEYDAQLALKEKQVRSKLERIAGIDGNLVKEIVPCDYIFRYRNKASMPISTGGLITKKGGIVEPVHEPRIGFRPLKSHEVIDCKDCFIQNETVMAAAEATRRYMEEDNIPSYDSRWDKGLMKSMVVKTAFGTGEVMVIYEINGKGVPNAAKLIEYLDDAIFDVGESLESVVIKNDKKVETLAGKNTITDIVSIPEYENLSVCYAQDAGNEDKEDNEDYNDGYYDEYRNTDGGVELQFEISANSFYQVNQEQMQKLYGIVRYFYRQVAKDRELRVLDLYCGIGTIGLCLADIAEHVHGIEIVKEAVIDANRNATINGIVNATYECGKAEQIIPKWVREGIPEVISNSGPEDDKIADIAIVDPPRAGCKSELIEAIADAQIENVIYVSCDPATLARDVKNFGELGYTLREAVPVDMFPHTTAVETCCLLVKSSDTAD